MVLLDMMDNIDKAYEDAHKDYEYRKNEIITKLVSIRDSEISNDIMKMWINQTINFINEREI